MDTAQMKAFLVVAECLNITNAAAQLYMSQSALSRQIIAVERELNMQLFVRRNNKLALTPAGRNLAINLRQVTGLYDTAIGEAELINSCMDGSVVIGVQQLMYVDDILCDVVRKFVRDYPRVDIRIVPVGAHTFDGMYRGEVDIILSRRFYLIGHSFAYRVLDKYGPLIVMSNDHPLAGKTGLTLRHFKDDRFILNAPDSDKKINDRFLEVCRENGFVPKCTFADNIYEANTFVGAGLGVYISDKRGYRSGRHCVTTAPIGMIGDPSLCLVWNEAADNGYAKEMLRYFPEGK